MNSSREKTIKSIELKKKKNLCIVSFTDGDIAQWSLDLVLKHSLAKGMVLNQNALDEINSGQRRFDIKQIAYNYASYKPRTVQQVKKRLRDNDFTEDEIKYALRFLHKFDFLDDKSYAVKFTKAYIELKPCGKIKLRNKLREKGIDGDIIDEVVEEFYPDDPINLALKNCEKKLRLLSSKAPDKRKNALIRYLQGQGYEWHTIRRVLDSLKEDGSLRN